jgi:hypothetical protein
MTTSTGAATVSRRRAMTRIAVRLFAVGMLASVTAACMTTTPAAVGAIPSGHARLKLTRADSWVFRAIPADVKVNGREVASVWKDSSTAVDISAGTNIIEIGNWQHPGVWKTTLNVKPSSTYTIEISPRGEGYAVALVGGLAASLVDAAINENAGAFQGRVSQ